MNRSRVAVTEDHRRRTRKRRAAPLRRAAVLPIAVLALLYAPFSLAAPSSTNASAAAPIDSPYDEGTITDTGLENLIEHRFGKKKGLENVEVDVRDGDATLTGTTATLHQKNQAEKITERIEDVMAVDNQIRLTSPEDRAVQDVIADVSKAFDNYAFYEIFDWVEARVNERTVTLTGSVTQPWKSNTIQQRVESIPGVLEVENQIDVQSVSGFDDRIRYQVAQAIYNDLAFIDRAHWADPPIHIIVEDGSVRLEGVVRNRAERALARSLASSAALSIGPIENNLVTHAEIEQ